ncbi:MAG: lysophospholipid acyltransferase family protein [Chloroflexota bacterium]|nr:lysophospholipid acyltransferase family protein [Chloroflexota bacterium]
MTPFFYDITTAAMKALLILTTRWQVEGKDNVPRTGPLIIVANHLHIMDPPLLGASVPRRINFMAKDDLFHRWMSRTIVQAYGAFPVKRGQFDKTALRRALEQLQKERALGIFPEGRRSLNGQLQAMQPGASLIAARSGAPIVPIGITGSEKVNGIGYILRRPKIVVRIGQPFMLPKDEYKPNRTGLMKHSDMILERIAELIPESYRGIYNDKNNSGTDSED